MAGTGMKSARGLFRATGKAAHPTLIGLDGNIGIYADEVAREKDDFYPTPPEPTRAILWAERERLGHVGKLWEPAAGNGAMTREIEAAGLSVFCSDIIDRDAGAEIKSFYDYDAMPAETRGIFTNPPFAECNTGKWIRHAMETLAAEYMALLLPLNFPGAITRADLWAKYMPARVYLMRWRIDFTGKGAPPMLNAWYIWDKSATNKVTELHMLDRQDGRQPSLDI